ncbi:DUF3375 domain-containing protein [Brevibacterium sp. GP-SGM9]|uniref:DUF3375 domain-containing protein n=1 Tax=unclassified Brevibacterium TaxID=2614124 RepID=UPI001E64F3F6|nr:MULTISPECIES: DUF3375 domain-containing protein [unclassified Brevibacterium]MCD1286604.1 DUF3375 domain-containing protein [Brevibacterium sp. CCUG 69071]MDK8434165.1 DUF3375 domain-containing protein [Brevibacterium sp. H-BE7]
MSALSSALAYRRLLESNATLRMLRADNIAIMAASLDAHLGRPGTRLNTEDLHESIDADLEELRDHFDLSLKTAKAYCDDWRRAEILVRRPATSARGETYELSAAGFDAVRILEQLRTPPQTATESRLVSLAQSVRQLAIDTDPDSSRRLASLAAERDRIDAEIARVRRGDPRSVVLDRRRANERVGDILQQAQGLPADFARVRARFEELNQELRVSILAAEDSQSQVLDEVFRGVDLIESSDEGRTFSAFSALVRDPEQAAAFDEDIAAILDRDFSATLSLETRRALRTLMRAMKDGSREVSDILSEFARGLRRYVHSHEFQRDRVMRTLIQEGLAAAAPVAKVRRPYDDIGIDLELSSVALASVGEVVLHDPAEFDAGEELGEAAESEVDFAELIAVARESEIDFAELSENINTVVGETAEASVAEVLDRFPATQGLASVVGLLSLASTYGNVDPESRELLEWSGIDGIGRSALIRRHYFTEGITL